MAEKSPIRWCIVIVAGVLSTLIILTAVILVLIVPPADEPPTDESVHDDGTEPQTIDLPSAADDGGVTPQHSARIKVIDNQGILHMGRIVDHADIRNAHG